MWVAGCNLESRPHLHEGQPSTQKTDRGARGSLGVGGSDMGHGGCHIWRDGHPQKGGQHGDNKRGGRCRPRGVRQPGPALGLALLCRGNSLGRR